MMVIFLCSSYPTQAGISKTPFLRMYCFVSGGHWEHGALVNKYLVIILGIRADGVQKSSQGVLRMLCVCSKSSHSKITAPIDSHPTPAFAALSQRAPACMLNNE